MSSIMGMGLARPLTGQEWLEVVQRVEVEPGVFQYRNFRAQLADVVGSLTVTAITAKDCPLDAQGRAALPSVPVGDLLLNIAVVKLSDGSYVDISDCTVSVEEGIAYVTVPEMDWEEINFSGQSLTVSYLAVTTAG